MVRAPANPCHHPFPPPTPHPTLRTPRCYLYVCANWCGVHHDEAFSALRVAAHKGFSRMRFMANGDLHLYTVATDAVPCEWVQDPRWSGPGGGGDTSGVNG